VKPWQIRVLLRKNKFAEVFKVACSSNSVIQSNKVFNEFLTAFDEYSHSQLHVHYDISVELVALCISKFKLGKASGLDGVETKHLGLL